MAYDNTALGWMDVRVPPDSNQTINISISPFYRTHATRLSPGDGRRGTQLAKKSTTHSIHQQHTLSLS